MTDATAGGPMAHVEGARTRWNRACRSWSADDGRDMAQSIALGEAMMFAATDLICALEDVIDADAGR